jgi:hypothetical protein
VNCISYFSSGTTLAHEPAAKLAQAVINDGNIAAINDGNIDASAVQLLVETVFVGEPISALKAIHGNYIGRQQRETEASNSEGTDQERRKTRQRQLDTSDDDDDDEAIIPPWITYGKKFKAHNRKPMDDA